MISPQGIRRKTLFDEGIGDGQRRRWQCRNPPSTVHRIGATRVGHERRVRLRANLKHASSEDAPRQKN
jgi:hypothetical protein